MHIYFPFLLFVVGLGGGGGGVGWGGGGGGGWGSPILFLLIKKMNLMFLLINRKDILKIDRHFHGVKENVLDLNANVWVLIAKLLV